MDESRNWSTASRRRGPSLILVGFVVNETVLRQVFLHIHLPSDTFATAAYSHLTPGPGTVDRSAKGSVPLTPVIRFMAFLGHPPVCYSPDHGIR
jgi:hypothetical protein